MKRPFSATVSREGKWFVSQCLDIDLASQGETEEEALANLREALELHFEPPVATNPPTVRHIEDTAGFREVGTKGSHVKFARVSDERTDMAIVPRKLEVPIGDVGALCDFRNPESSGRRLPARVSAKITDLLAEDQSFSIFWKELPDPVPLNRERRMGSRPSLPSS